MKQCLSTMPARRCHGFTLVELLVVIAIIAILAALLLPAINAALQKADKAQARHEVSGMVTALKAYLNDYSRFPHGGGNLADYSYGTNSGANAQNRNLMNTLRSIDGVGNVGFVSNPRRTVYLEMSDSSIVDGNYVDPWGQQYEITVDTGFDGACNSTRTPALITNRNVIVWSRGPDGANAADDIKSWTSQ